MSAQKTYVYLESKPDYIFTVFDFLWQPSVNQFIKLIENDPNGGYAPVKTIKRVSHVSIPSISTLYKHEIFVNVYLKDTDIENADEFAKVCEIVK